MFIVIIYPPTKPLQSNIQLIQTDKLNDAIQEIYYPAAQYKSFDAIQEALIYIKGLINSP